MTEHKYSSPINIFKPSSVPGAGASGAIGKKSQFDISFSRELSRASDSAQPSRESLNRAKRYDRDDGRNMVSTRTDNTNRTNPSDSKKAEDGTDKISATRSRPEQDSGEKVSQPAEKSGHASDGSRAEEIERRDRLSQEAADDEETTIVKEFNAGDKMPGMNDGELSLETGLIPIDEILDVDLLADSISGSEEINAGSEEPDSDLSKALLDGGVTGSDADPVAVGNLKVPTTTGDEMASPTSQRLPTGEHLSPGQLANRQAHLLKNVEIRDLGSNSSVKLPISDNTDVLASAVRIAPAPTTASLVMSKQALVVNNENLKAGADGVRKLDVIDVKPTLPQSLTGELSVKQATADLEQGEDLVANLAAKKSAQQEIKSTLTQGLQLAQQQAQNLKLATTVNLPDPVDKVMPSQSTDNMFLSLQGGIVTAPSVPRPDAGISQTMNAPITTPILQTDADKAMAGNIRWMVNEGVKNAVVNVTPNGMGPITVSIGIEKDQMNVSIVALQGATREALDSMLPRLRDQLAAQGHDSVRVDISDGRSEHTDRGYGNQFAEQQNGSEKDGQMVGGSNTKGDSEDEHSIEAEKYEINSQGLTTLNEFGQVRSRYDVYV